MMQNPSKQRRDRIDQFVEEVLLPIIAFILILGVAALLLELWLP